MNVKLISAETQVPRDWSRRPLYEAAAKIQDGTHFSPVLGGTDYKYVTSKNIGPGYLKLKSITTISAQEHRKIYRRCDVKYGDLLLTKDGANTGNAALSLFREEVSLLSSVAFVRADHRYALEAYLLQYLLSGPGRRQIADAMSGNAITRLTLAKINKIVIPLPPIREQRKIVSVFTTLDDQIRALKALSAKKEAVKRGLMQQFLTGDTRLPGFTRRWESRRLADLLNYEQPGLFLVHTSTQLGQGGTPVLTAGKTFLLGYTNETSGIYRAHPVIIFDDFTTTSKFVDFDFKVKSSAIKILSARPGANLKFVYERMQLMRFPLGDHKRYWISEYSQQTIDVPEPEEQDAIVQVLQDCTNDIQLLNTRLAKAEAIKQGMMQELLTGRTRLSVVKEIAA